ncbi:probable cytochrome P450 6a23 [Teleopsis dalmanni]|uniref:probable cytochrome P450 6a23 n=1 Tax=Teleopsis dalmanni TaxID=139649 RepID=UPI0018CD0820|nr:probable cytochrome P450 6a23 [Teleopsis dalmanni]
MEVFIVLLLGAGTLFVFYINYLLGYWKRRGLPHDKPEFLVGNMNEWRKTKHIAEIFADTYKQYKNTGPFAGFYLLMTKSAVITDIDLVKRILIKDFNNFDERGLFHNDRDDPLTGNLFDTDGDKWRQLRHKLTPTFTSGKMKNMFSIVSNIGSELEAVISEKTISAPQVLEVNEFLGRFTADVIGVCAFGIECNSLRNPNAEFVKIGRRVFTESRHNKVVEGLMHTFPDIARMLRMRIIPQDISDFYMRIVKDTVGYREKNNIKRNDFMDMLIDLKNRKPTRDENGKIITGLTENDVAAQSFVFFVAGFETSSTTMGFALYELAQNQDIQDKLRREINETIKKHNNEFTYECMKDMHYLEQVIDETLRLHPVGAHLIRKARSHYETSDPKYYIEEGTLIVIPSLAIHHDPEFYPEPEKFKPERFSAEEIKSRPSCTWLPFGEGPRNCIGLRFGKMQACIGLTYLIKNFKFTVAKETQIPYILDVEPLVLNAKNGIHLMVEKI